MHQQFHENYKDTDLELREKKDRKMTGLFKIKRGFRIYPVIIPASVALR
jgi:hypothetical protein